MAMMLTREGIGPYIAIVIFVLFEIGPSSHPYPPPSNRGDDVHPGENRRDDVAVDASSPVVVVPSRPNPFSARGSRSSTPRRGAFLNACDAGILRNALIQRVSDEESPLAARAPARHRALAHPRMPLKAHPPSTSQPPACSLNHPPSPP